MVAIHEGHAEALDTLLRCRTNLAKRDRLSRDVLYWACLCLDRVSRAMGKMNDSNYLDRQLLTSSVSCHRRRQNKHDRIASTGRKPGCRAGYGGQYPLELRDAGLTVFVAGT
jgi:hypothetical protein